MDCNPPGSSVRGISQARILEWVTIPFSKGFSWSRNWICISCNGRQIFFFFLNQWATTVLQLNKHTAKCKWQKPALGGRRDSRWGFDAAPRLLHFPSIHHRPSAARTGCDRQLLILPHVSAQVSQPAATTGRRKASGQVFRSASAAQAAPGLYRLLAMKFSVGISKSPVIKDKPRLPCKPPVIKGKPRPPCKPPVIKDKPRPPSKPPVIKNKPRLPADWRERLRRGMGPGKTFKP